MSQPAYALPPGVTIMGVQPGFTRNNKQKFDVQCSDGQTYTCFRSESASKAQALVGQQGVTIMVSMSDDGRFKNFEDSFQGGGGIQQQFIAPQAAPAQNGTFTPAPGFVQALDAKDLRISRGNAINAASAALAPLIGTGWLLHEDGDLQTETVSKAIIDLARGLAQYIIEGPGGGEAAAPAAEAPALPPGVTPEQVAAWAAAQGAGGIAVGAPVPTPATPEAAPAAY